MICGRMGHNFEFKALHTGLQVLSLKSQENELKVYRSHDRPWQCLFRYICLCFILTLSLAEFKDNRTFPISQTFVGNFTISKITDY